MKHTSPIASRPVVQQQQQHQPRHQTLSSTDMNGPQYASAIPFIRRKRPRAIETNDHLTCAFPARASIEEAPRARVLPGLAELLAAQQSPPLLQSQWRPTLPNAIEHEDKTPWPSAVEYYRIFSTPEPERKLQVFDLGVDRRGVPLHPEFIYNDPVSCMYFLKCSKLIGKGSFGFPRKKKELLRQQVATFGHARAAVIGFPATSQSQSAKKQKKLPDASKDFEWRKMSFVTGLPKKQPLVRYVTATCYSRATEQAAKQKVFRMHAVMLADKAGTGECGDYVLVHIRAGGSKRVGVRTSGADTEVQQTPTSPGAIYEDIAPAKQGTNSLSAQSPVSPTSVAVASCASVLTSTSPCNKHLMHAAVSAGSSENSGDRTQSVVTASLSKMDSTARVPRCSPLFSVAEEPDVGAGRVALRNMILKACTSPEEVTKYVRGLQEELAALQSSNQRECERCRA
ncbi:unnamed protein product [Hyaloperonospora brassicae]|uniref:Uncharacterized protein n=1 Tax=Hyaloperonospora brassicae TaxID=162125 RepID=A0AAV0UFW3_HYABA|nr:unnamed protein product [Hyaloperonospora brassicae]